MDTETLTATVEACQDLILRRFPDDSHRGAAAVLLADESILTGTSPDSISPSTSVCHEVKREGDLEQVGPTILAAARALLPPNDAAVTGPQLVVVDADEMVWRVGSKPRPRAWLGWEWAGSAAK